MVGGIRNVVSDAAFRGGGGGGGRLQGYICVAVQKRFLMFDKVETLQFSEVIIEGCFIVRRLRRLWWSDVRTGPKG